VRAIVKRIEETVSGAGKEQTFLIGILRNGADVAKLMLGQTL
jgi:hypothetical protein